MTSRRLMPLVPWMLRAAWIGVLVAGATAIDQALAERSSDVADVGRWTAAAIWVIGVGAMALPAVVSLTATRVVVPLSVPVAIASATAGAELLPVAAFVLCSLVSVALALSPELGRAFVQASAYGDETRHLLRAPAAYLMACVVTWVVWAAAVITGPLLVAAHVWVIGGVVCIVAIAGAVWAWSRWHKLSRRWFVIVPTGVVVHDHVVLAETLMIKRNELAGLRLAAADTEALDLTGPASGHAVEITTVEPVTAILAARPSTPRGTAVHVSACLVCPTRPGQMLADAAERRIRVG